MLRPHTNGHRHRTTQERADDANLLRDSGVHKLAITDRDGNCVAYLLTWGSVSYDPDTDTFVCRVDGDDAELVTVYTEGDVRAQPGSGMCVVTAPETDARTVGEAS